MIAFADLHIHSTYSDGTASPAEIVQRAKALGVRALALTDHNTTAGVSEFLNEASYSDVIAIPGVEILTSFDQLRVEILGYYIDLSNHLLIEILADSSSRRTENTKRMFDWLCESGLLEYSWDRVVFHNQGKTNLCSLDVFRAMMRDGFFFSCDQGRKFHQQHFGESNPEYMNLTGCSATDAIHAVLEAGGIPVLAHPKLIGDDEAIEALIGDGLEGIEVYHPAHNHSDIKRYKTYAKEYGLLITGGTDWHGDFDKWDVQIGEYGIDEKLFCDLVEETATR